MSAAHSYLKGLEACGELSTDIKEAPMADVQAVTELRAGGLAGAVDAGRRRGD